MDTLEAMRQRHSVRKYNDAPLTGEDEKALDAFIKECETESGLEIRLITDEPKAFDCLISHYGRFRGVRNYIVISGPKDADNDEKCGYYGEKIVIEAQKLGLRTCWVALTYNRKSEIVNAVKDGYKVMIVISLGYGLTDGKPRRSKSFSDVAKVKGDVPEWFRTGVEYALMAPTAVNQQKFRFELTDDNRVIASCPKGSLTKMDLGIVKYHFEEGAGKDNFEWA